MKKIIAFFVVFIFVGTILSAQVSIGVGGTFGVQSKRVSYHVGDSIIDTDYTNGGGYIFFDAKFVELDLGARYGLDKKNFIGNQNPGFNATYVYAGVLGKFPIKISDLITVFPLTGVEYGLALIRNNADTGDSEHEIARIISDYSRIWLKAGAGADFNLTRSFYVRPSAFYAFGFNSPRDRVDVEKAILMKNIMHHSFDLRVAAGIKF
jgi:hypothetical protein